MEALWSIPAENTEPRSGALILSRNAMACNFCRKEGFSPLLILLALRQHPLHHRLPRNSMSLRCPFAQIDELAAPGAERPLWESGSHQNFFFAGGAPDGKGFDGHKITGKNSSFADNAVAIPAPR